MPEFGPKYMGDMLWAFGIFGHRDEALLSSATDTVLTKWDAMTGDDESLAKIIWAMQQLNYSDKRLEDRIAGLGVQLPDSGGASAAADGTAGRAAPSAAAASDAAAAGSRSSGQQ